MGITIATMLLVFIFLYVGYLYISAYFYGGYDYLKEKYDEYKKRKKDFRK